MVNIKTLSDRIIFDGHADTAKECETITLMCDGLACNNNFRTVAYRKGYAEFEKVGVAKELKFAALSYKVIFTFDSGVEKIAWSRDKDFIGGNYINTSPGEIPSSNISSFGFTVILLSGYEITNVNIPTDALGSGSVEELDDHTFWIMTDGGIDIDIAITTKQSAPKVSIDLTSLSGYESLAAGTYQLGVKAKASGYTDSDLSSTVSFTKLAAPVATAADTTVTWDAITNAESYDVYVDGQLYENTTGGG